MSSLALCKIFRCTSPFTIIWPFAQDTGVNITAEKWSMMAAVLDMNNICIAAIGLSQASGSELMCPWLHCCLHAGCLGFFDVRTLPPADSTADFFFMYTIRSLHKLSDRRHVEWGGGVTPMLQNDHSLLWQLICGVRLLSCHSASSVPVSFTCSSRTCRVLDMLLIFVLDFSSGLEESHTG